jgi:hypothetical protein
VLGEQRRQVTLHGGGELDDPGCHPGRGAESHHVVQGDQFTTRLTTPSGLGGRVQRQRDRCRKLAASSADPGVDRPGEGIE